MKQTKKKLENISKAHVDDENNKLVIGSTSLPLGVAGPLKVNNNILFL